MRTSTWTQAASRRSTASSPSSAWLRLEREAAGREAASEWGDDPDTFLGTKPIGRIGFGAMQLAGPGVKGPPRDPRRRTRRPAPGRLSLAWITAVLRTGHRQRADPAGRLDLEQLAALVVNLERGVVKAKALMEHRLKRPAGGVAILFAAHQHVGR